MGDEHAPKWRTPQEIAQLKADWERDPIWDLFETEGFEAHRKELAEHQVEKESQWRVEHDRRCTAAAIRVGFFDMNNPYLNKITFGQYILHLEKTIAELRDRIEFLESR